MLESILNRYHHNPLRLEKYRDSAYSVDTSIATIGELPVSTFMNKSVVLGGIKTDKKRNIRLQADYMMNRIYM